MQKEFIYKTRIYFEDTDAEGVVYYANYLKFMERARSEWLLSLGFSLSGLAADGLMLVVRRVMVDYLHPARLEDQLEIVTTVEEISKVKIVFKQIVRMANNSEIICCTGLTTLVSVDRKLQPCRMLPGILEGFANGN